MEPAMMETQNRGYPGDRVLVTTAKAGMKETPADSCLRAEWRRNRSIKVDRGQKETAVPAALDQSWEEVTAWMERQCSLCSPKLYRDFREIEATLISAG